MLHAERTQEMFLGFFGNTFCFVPREWQNEWTFWKHDHLPPQCPRSSPGLQTIRRIRNGSRIFRVFGYLSSCRPLKRIFLYLPRTFFWCPRFDVFVATGIERRSDRCSATIGSKRQASPSVYPFTPKSDQFQISPAASPEILHHTVWRTWVFKAYLDERRLYY